MLRVDIAGVQFVKIDILLFAIPAGYLRTISLRLDSTVLPNKDDSYGALLSAILIDPLGKHIQVNENQIVSCICFICLDKLRFSVQVGGYGLLKYTSNTFSMYWPDAWFGNESSILVASRDVSAAYLSSPSMSQNWTLAIKYGYPSS
jgi:hypothetical protein